jgi:hypothetical protein
MNNKPKSFWQRYAWAGVVVLCLATYAVLQSSWLMDTLKGWGYEPAEKVVAIESDLQLTAAGRRIFAATRPTVEGSREFNEHCDSHDAEISLLGCYIDGRIYIYEIELAQLAPANKVTAAHELLHAVWERMGESERRQVSGWLDQVYNERREWFEGELEVYDAEDRREEIYARAGTKLADLPDELENHYAKYFQNRAVIVQFYQDYEAPSLALQLEMEELFDQIQAVSEEVELGRETYLRDLEKLDAKIDQFNACAETAGCFVSQAEFTRQRQALLAEREHLEAVRAELNGKIAQNNQRIQDYRERQLQLGELNNAMNSNIELLETI